MADILIRGMDMPNRRTAELMHTELACVSRECDRHCENCDLVQDRDELIVAFHEAIRVLETVANAAPLPEGHGRLMPEWISVNDRLPGEERKDYLCYAKGGYLLICFWTDDIFGLGRWSGEWGWSLLTAPKYDEITHWMPLPEPPEEGGGEDGK